MNIELLLKALKSNNTLIIITGISSSGKSTLANKFKEELSIHYYAVDNYKVKEYEQYGFLDKSERKVLRDLAISKFQAEIIKHMRNGGTLVIEYPFRKEEWQKFFDGIATKYCYTTLIVNCNTKDFEEIWSKRLERDTYFINRAKCLTASAYIKNRTYIRAEDLTEEAKEIQRKAYKDNIYTSIEGDYIINDVECNQLIEEAKKRFAKVYEEE